MKLNQAIRALCKNILIAGLSQRNKIFQSFDFDGQITFSDSDDKLLFKPYSFPELTKNKTWS